MKPFQEIFKKEKSKCTSIVRHTIIIDNREKSSLVPSELLLLGFKIKYKQLQIADYIIGKTAIERKTISDLKSSIVDKRFFNQLKELKRYPSNLLIIEGNSEELYDSIHINKNAIQGILISTLLDYKIPLIFSKNSKETAEILLRISKKTKKEISLRINKKIKTKFELQQYILEGFPNIGPKTSQKLLKEFKTLFKIFSAQPFKLKKILKEKTEKFNDLLN